MDNKATALAQLKDIHMPASIGWWPLAPGWYLLGLLIILIVLSVFLGGLRYYHQNRAKRQALSVLERYQKDYLNHANSQLTAARLSELLKRVALVYYPRTRVASLQGQAWVDFLNATASHCDFTVVREHLINTPYQPPKSCDLTALFDLVKLWIKQRRGRCLN
jgi:hypothetical protein